MITVTLVYIIIAMAMMSIYSSSGNFFQFVYGQALGNEVNPMNIGEKLSETNKTNLNVSEINMPMAGDIIPGEWIVVLRENATLNNQIANDHVSTLYEDLSDLGVNVTIIPQLGQLSVDLNQIQLETDQPEIKQEILEIVDNDPNTLLIEPHRIYTIQSQSVPTGIDRIGADKSGTMAGDGQDKVSDVTIAIIDTGIDLDHPDLNVILNKSFIDEIATGDDDNGHGTHVAGIVAAKDDSQGVIGVAPGANLVALKVADRNGTGTTLEIIKAIDWVTANRHLIDIVSINLGGVASIAIEDAISKSIDSGVTYVVAAGNNNEDVSHFSPANSHKAITVSAVSDSDGKCGAKGPATSKGSDDSFASYSNYGEMIDIAAPGTNINSTYSNGQYRVLTGTSMAAAHVAGAAALIVSESMGTWHEKPSPEQIEDTIKSIAIRPVTQCTEHSGYFSRQSDRDEIGEPLLSVTALSQPP